MVSGIVSSAARRVDEYRRCGDVDLILRRARSLITIDTMFTPPIITMLDSLWERWLAIASAEEPDKADANAELLAEASSSSAWGRTIDHVELVDAARASARQLSCECWCGGWGMLAGFAADAAQLGFSADTYKSLAGQQPVGCFRCGGSVTPEVLRELRQRPECTACRGSGLAPAWSTNVHCNGPGASELRQSVRGWLPMWCALCGGFGRTARPEQPQLARVDDGWMVSFAGTTAYVRDLMGIRHIARVLDAPNQEIDATSLVRGAVAAEPAVVEDGARIATTTSVADRLDSGVKRAYRERLLVNVAELEDATEAGDLAWRARLEEEQSALLREINRSRRSETADERRARDAARKAISDAVRAIRRVHPKLAEHLDRSVRFGGTIRYCS